MNEALTVTTSGIPGTTDLLVQVRSVGRSLWLAGLGALGTIVDLDRGSRERFDHLVERGRPVAERQMQRVDEIGDRASGKLRAARELVRDQVRYDTDRVLARLGVPTREDWSTLAQRLEALSRKIDELA